MKYLSVAIIILIVLASVDSFGQNAMSRSLSEAKETKETKVKKKFGVFGEVISLEEEEESKSDKHFDLNEETEIHFDLVDDVSILEESTKYATKYANNMMNVMVINERNSWNAAPPKSKAFLFHTAKKITNESGFYIQLLESNQILDKEHKIYQEFGNLRVRQNPEDKYNYLIGNFLSEKSGNKFLKDIILPRYPEAKLIKLSEGKL